VQSTTTSAMVFITFKTAIMVAALHVIIIIIIIIIIKNCYTTHNLFK